MKNSFFYLFFVLLACVCGCTGIREKKNVLVFCGFGEGYVHDNIPAAAKMFTELGRQYGFDAVVKSNNEVFNEDSLSGYDAVVYANASYVGLNGSQKGALQKFIRGGGAFMGIHAAACQGGEWEWFTNMTGANFDRHPPLHVFDVRTVGTGHPAVGSLPASFKVNDELYIFKNINPDIEILAVSSSPQLQGEYPAVWCNEFEGGRIWYTALGHLKEDYETPFYRRHIMDGLGWILETDF